MLIGKNIEEKNPISTSSKNQTVELNGSMNGVPNNNDNDSIIKEIAPHIIIPKGDDAALIRLRAQNTLRKIRASWLFLEYQVNMKNKNDLKYEHEHKLKHKNKNKK